MNSTRTPEQTLTEWERQHTTRRTSLAAFHQGDTSRGLEYLTIYEAAEITRRKPWPIYEAIRAGELTAFQPGGEGRWLIRPAHLRAYVEGVSA